MNWRYRERLMWFVPPRNQGQAVYYRYAIDGDCLYRERVDDESGTVGDTEFTYLSRQGLPEDHPLMAEEVCLINYDLDELTQEFRWV